MMMARHSLLVHGILLLGLLLGRVVVVLAQENVTSATATATATAENETETPTSEEPAEGSDETPILWASTGGGWRAMFACVGFANAFQQAGLFSETSSRFSGISTTSGASWFSTQFFYSREFYRSTALARTPEEVNNFVVQWMATYSNISGTVDEETLKACNTSDLVSNLEERGRDPDSDYVTAFQDICFVLIKYNYDWTEFIQAMLLAASTGYGDPTFVDRLAQPENRIDALLKTNLLIQATIVPNSRIRPEDNTSQYSTAVYLGYPTTATSTDSQLFTVPLSAAYIIDPAGGRFVYGSEDKTSQLQTYLAETPTVFSWSDWQDFFLYPGTSGTIEISNTQDNIGAAQHTDFRTPFGGPQATTVLQVAAISSAAGGSGSPLVPSTFSQNLSIGYYTISQATVKLVWRIMAGMAVGLVATVLVAFVVRYFSRRCCVEKSAIIAGIVTGVILGAAVGAAVGIFYGLGSIVVPTVFDNAVQQVYAAPQFDNFAVCSQWPNTCGESDGIFIDGWFVDNPALVINVGHQQQKMMEQYSGTGHWNKPIKVIITNTNQSWNTTYNYAQFLQYFQTYFNTDVAPGNFLWAPGYWTPFRSPQIFKEYLDEAGLDAALEPILDSNMTTALLTGTTVDNPAFGVTAGQVVEILLLNTNVNITTYVIGQELVDNFTQPLADLASSIASNQEIIRRVSEFVAS